MNALVKCETCAYWAKFEQGSEGACRKSPPAVLQYGVTYWPKTRGDVWCGSWRKHGPSSHDELMDIYLGQLREQVDYLMAEEEVNVNVLNIDKILTAAGFGPTEDRSGEEAGQ